MQVRQDVCSQIIQEQDALAVSLAGKKGNANTEHWLSGNGDVAMLVVEIQW